MRDAQQAHEARYERHRRLACTMWELRLPRAGSGAKQSRLRHHCTVRQEVAGSERGGVAEHFSVTCPPQGACAEDLDGDGVVGVIAHELGMRLPTL